ncbi:uncharacterized protein LOC133887093 [Phragmites australis]|uniref:uncharacterized protein LOC133887093 n=1 Tax=Phragmites australis TaxID=29695 RepID=UPI002D79FD0D|nr:uncharacterized protein LOC133887093 [Phragmites australis]
MKVLKSGWPGAEVFGADEELTPWRHVVINLPTKTCTCREWQLTGKPCLHALAFIISQRNIEVEDYVHEYYFLERFMLVYATTIQPMTDKSQWPQVGTGFKLMPPKQKKKTAGRTRKLRFKAADEPGAKKQHRCKKCGEYGPREAGCIPKKRTSKKKEPFQARTVPTKAISPGAVTRRMLALTQARQNNSGEVTSGARRLLVLSQEPSAPPAIRKSPRKKK